MSNTLSLGCILMLEGSTKCRMNGWERWLGDVIEKAVNPVDLTAVQQKGLPTGESEALAA